MSLCLQINSISMVDQVFFFSFSCSFRQKLCPIIGCTPPPKRNPGSATEFTCKAFRFITNQICTKRFLPSDEVCPNKYNIYYEHWHCCCFIFGLNTMRIIKQSVMRTRRVDLLFLIYVPFNRFVTSTFTFVSFGYGYVPRSLLTVRIC